MSTERLDMTIGEKKVKVMKGDGEIGRNSPSHAAKSIKEPNEKSPRAIR